MEEEIEETESQILRERRSNQLQRYLFWMIPPCLALLFLVILLASVMRPSQSHIHEFNKLPFSKEFKPEAKSGFKGRNVGKSVISDLTVEFVHDKYNATDAENYCKNKFRTTLAMPRTDKELNLLLLNVFNNELNNSCGAFHIGIRRVVSHDVAHHTGFYSPSKTHLDPINVLQSCSVLKYLNSSWDGVEVSCNTKSNCLLCQRDLECMNQDYCYETVRVEDEIGFLDGNSFCKNTSAGQLAVISEEDDFNNIVDYLTHDIHDTSCKHENIYLLIGNRYRPGFETFHENSVNLRLLAGIQGKLWENCVIIGGQFLNKTKMAPCEEQFCSICWRSGNEEEITPLASI